MSKEDVMITTVRIKKELWDRFLQKVYQENGKTHGGVIRRTIERLIKEYVE
ncbi:MAG: hypothetical protein GTN80_00675 [Nitrososphaeria archaeon]|nr:hypothetical protein [Nitrososphaeria archaeon]NIQ32160.1 hypothetical protein [Nitrososphaeria archaeon]